MFLILEFYNGPTNFWYYSSSLSSINFSCSKRSTTADRSTFSFLRISFSSWPTLYENLRVDNDSSTFSFSELIVAIMTVLQLPPKLSFKMVVINELRYGICCRLNPFIFSFRAMITYSKYVNDRFIYFASFSRFPSTWVLLILSEPARSTRCNLLRQQVSDPFSRPSKVIVKTQWERDEH